MAVMKKGGKDFSQIGYLQVTESAANTLTFAGLSVFSNALGQKGMIIRRIEYFMAASVMAYLAASGDKIRFGLSGDDGMATVDLNDAEVYDFNEIMRLDLGTAASGLLEQSPYVKDYSNLPGQGILVPADRLYLYAEGGSLASPVVLQARFWFDIVDLSASDYLELAQSMRVLK